MTQPNGERTARWAALSQHDGGLPNRAWEVRIASPAVKVIMLQACCRQLLSVFAMFFMVLRDCGFQY